jgi:phage host-nuclease inhibitor protein Gam
MKLTTDTDLTNLVSDLAQKQILIERAKGQVQATVEAAKLAYDEATRDIIAEINSGFEAINAYCTENKDRLFPVKKGKRQKTYAVLQHKLQYRSSSEVTAPDDIIARIIARIDALCIEARSLNAAMDHDAISAEIDLLNTLLRHPPIEFSKDAAGSALAHETTALQLDPLGINITQNETFKLTFTLTPGQ